MERYQVTGSIVIQSELSPFELIVINQTVSAKNEDDAARIVLLNFAKKHKQFSVGWDSQPDVVKEKK